LINAISNRSWDKATEASQDEYLDERTERKEAGKDHVGRGKCVTKRRVRALQI